MAEPGQYPIFLELAECPVLIVGGGAVALRKARGLVNAHARVTVVSPQFAPGFTELTTIERIATAYAAAHMALKKWRLVFIATNDSTVNETAQQHAAAHAILCCRSDEPDRGDFSNGATWTSDGGSITLAVATAGASPVLARQLRDHAVQSIDPILITWAELMGTWRKRAKLELTDPAARRELLSRMAGPAMGECLRAHGAIAATALFDEWLHAFQSTPSANSATSRVPDHDE